MKTKLPHRAWVDLERFEWMAATPEQALLRLYGVCALPAEETHVYARLVAEHESPETDRRELWPVQEFSLDRQEPDLGDPRDLVVGRWSCAFSAPCELVRRAGNQFVFELDGWTRIPLPAPAERRLRPPPSHRPNVEAAVRRTFTRFGRLAVSIVAGVLIGLVGWLAVNLVSTSPHAPAPHAAKRGAKLLDSRNPVSDARSARSFALSRGPSLVARATVARVPVYRSPTASASKSVMSNPNRDGAPLVLLVVGAAQHGRLRVMLPTRPNLSQGWIPREDVRLAVDPYRLLVSLTRHVMIVRRGGRILQHVRIGVGRRAVTPTPFGLYYITELLKQPDPGGAYGPYAFGLSAHSSVLHEFAGGNGEIGLHGTNQPGTIGRDVSHGCIRVYNTVITRLAGELPLGTPVRIEN